jgi:hypothetical protein
MRKRADSSVAAIAAACAGWAFAIGMVWARFAGSFGSLVVAVLVASIATIRAVVEVNKERRHG